MAKTESTAVNDLIKIATTQTPLRQDPSDDLMFAAPSKKDRSTKQQSSFAPRGKDVPLPRAPHGTQELEVTSSPRIAPPPLPPRATMSSPAIAPPPLPRPSTPPVVAVAAAPELLSDSFDMLTNASGPSFASLEVPTDVLAAVEPSTVQPPAMRPPLPSEYPVVSAVHSQPFAPAPAWADDSIDVDVAPIQRESTAQLARPRTTLEWMIKLAPLAGAMIVLGVFVGGYLVFDGQGGKRRSANAAAPGGSVEVKVVADEAEPVAAVAAVTPPNLAATTEPVAVTPPNLAAEPTPAPPAMPSITTPAPTAAEIAPRLALVDIRIDSKPSGATVTLVDRGKQTFLGTTPISTAVDPSRSYDVVFAHPRRPTQTAHLDPKAANRLAVVLGRTGTPSMATELAKPAAPVTTIAKSAPVAPVAKAAKSVKIVKPAKLADAKAPVESAPAVVKAEKAVVGNGTLMISSKPPCEIHVDGTSTGLMTPQRSLTLPAGKHKITLVNPGLKIKKSVAVEITANESTKVIQDLTELMP